MLAQVWASLAVELATVPVLPLDYTPYGQAMQGYLSSLQNDYATALGVDLSSLMDAAEVGEETGSSPETQTDSIVRRRADG